MSQLAGRFVDRRVENFLADLSCCLRSRRPWVHSGGFRIPELPHSPWQRRVRRDGVQGGRALATQFANDRFPQSVQSLHFTLGIVGPPFWWALGTSPQYVAEGTPRILDQTGGASSCAINSPL